MTDQTPNTLELGAQVLIQATQEQVQAEQDVLNSTVQWIKFAFIAIQVVIVSYLLVEAILSRMRKTGEHDQISIMMCCNIVILIALVFFDWGTKYVAGFYILAFFQNYINFLGFNYLVRKLRTPERKKLRSKTNVYFGIMNALYLVNFIMTFTKGLGPWCTQTKLYPPVMNFSAVLFLFNAFFHFYAHSNDYWLQWEKHPKIAEIIGREEEYGWEDILKTKEIFTQQMSVFVKFQAAICGILVMIHLMVIFYIDPEKNNYLGCSRDGFEWIYETTQGSLFMLMHMACICLQAIMLEKVFYSVPKDFGYYEANANDESVDEIPWYTLPHKKRYWDPHTGKYIPIVTQPTIEDDGFRQQH